ncbi:MAG: branched-chain amino acid transport system substrate-binding protein [Chloroflexota bacterium]|jgi:hypothetical protein|nr:branched-chain amino acid transport system substrate-binding protein [Chloroflexota bacterium]
MSVDRSRGRITRSIARLAGGVVLALVVVPAAAQADQGSVPVDHQAYVSETPVDPHNADAVAIHIDVKAGQETAQSYLHVNFNFLPEGATLDSLVLTLQPTAPATAGAPDPNNVNSSAAVLNFCILTEPIPADITPSHAPLKHDCTAASRVGSWQPDGSYKVDLRPLAARWLAGPDYGAVILPVQGPTDTYSVGFDRGKTTTVAQFTPQATDTQPQPQTQPAPAQTEVIPAPGSGGVVIGPGTIVSPDFSQPTPAAQPSAPAPVIHHQPQPAPQTSGGGTPSGPSGWPLFVLIAAAAAGVGLLAYPVGQALSAGGAGVGAGLMQQLRLHPRLFATTGILGVYSLTFGSYTLAHPNTAQPAVSAQQQALNSSPSPEAGTSPSPDASAVPGATPGAGQPGAAGAPVGTTRVINGTSVFVPANGGPPSANLFPASQDRIGISDSQIKLCGHAALTYASAFNTSPTDFNVFWSNVNAHGGIYGRQVAMDYKNDNYDPTTAVQAAQQCSDEGIFMLLGGIGFDQIPNVRMWAEQNRMLYIHHIATANGTAGLKYSFAPLPTVEEAGRMFAQLYLHDFKGKKIGILHRGSIYWDPGYNAFRQALRDAGLEDKIVSESPVKQNQGSYAQELARARQNGAEVMWAWENALDTPEMIKQAKSQQWSPNWMVFPFNVELTALQANGDALNPPIVGVAAWPAYTKGQYDGPFASYAADIHEFEREYHDYDPNVDLGGAGGDLLFLNWVAQKQLYQQLLDCGRDCTRNKFAGMMLTGYKKTVSPNCQADWSRVSHRGGFALDIFTTYQNSAGNAAWEPVALCVEHY